MSARNARYRAEVQWVRKREAEQRHQETWNNQCKYYDTFTRKNQQFQSWTNPKNCEESLRKFRENEAKLKQKERDEAERNKRDIDLFKENQRKQIELDKERLYKQRQPRRFPGPYETPLDVLKSINYDLKDSEEHRRRREAEQKLYQQWRANNPCIRDFESKQQHKNLKLSWLDAQIEKQMVKEKEKEELKKYLEERQRKIQIEEEHEKELEEKIKNRTKETNEIISKQIEELKQRDKILEMLKHEESIEARKRDELDRIVKEREDDQRRRQRQDIDLYNLKHYRLRLRRRVKSVTEEIAAEQRVYRRIFEDQQREKEQQMHDKFQLREALLTAIDCLKQQEIIEKERENYLGFMFDSEAKLMWERQEGIWQQEQRARDLLFEDVIGTVRKQIDEKLAEKIERQKEIITEKGNMIELIERAGDDLRQEHENMLARQQERQRELDEFINNKKLQELQAEIKEKEERDQELDKARREEERLRKEIEKIQLKHDVDPNRFHKRKIIW